MKSFLEFVLENKFDISDPSHPYYVSPEKIDQMVKDLKAKRQERIDRMPQFLAQKEIDRQKSREAAQRAVDDVRDMLRRNKKPENP